jgi:hypothetical protein
MLDQSARFREIRRRHNHRYLLLKLQRYYVVFYFCKVCHYATVMLPDAVY